MRSEPTLASTEGSARLKRTEEMVSLEVGKVRLEIGEDFVSSQICTVLDAVANNGSSR